MPFVLQVVLVIYLFMLLHVSTMALCARALRMDLRAISFGTGGAIWEKGLIRFAWFPFGGYVRFKDSRDEDLPDSELAGAWDRRPIAHRLAVILSAPIATIGLSLLVLRHEGWNAFIAAFGQTLHGALMPMSTAQELLAVGAEYALTHSFMAFAALFTVKLTAFNLLPLPMLNGGQAVSLVLTGGKLPQEWQHRLMQWSILPLFALFLSWTFAFIAHVVTSLPS